MTSWENAFCEMFAEISGPLGCILRANGCREGWLQGEVFRHFRSRDKAVYTNYVTLPSPGGLKNRKADLAIYSGHENYARLQLVGEIKVYGERGYYAKNLTGGSLIEVQRRIADSGKPITFSNCRADRQLVTGYGLLADYFRLVDFVSEDTPTKLLLLCVQKHESPDEFGRVLRRVEFEAPGVLLCDKDDFWAKCWTLGGTSRG